MKKYDESLKKFVGANPQSFLDWLLPGATITRALPTELHSCSIFVDALYETQNRDGKRLLVHFEFQRSAQNDMPERLLEYNILASRQYKASVYSCVIYLTGEGSIEESPLIWYLPDGDEVVRFHYQSVRLWDEDPSQFRKPGQEGILPLVVLTKGNARPEIVDEVIQRLFAAGQESLLPMTEVLASLAFGKNVAYTEWLSRRFVMLHDILRDTPAYQRILQEGREEGREEGRQEGRLLGVRDAFLTLVQARFPHISKLVKTQVDSISDLHVLEDALVKVYTAQTEVEMLQIVVDMSKL